MNSKRWFVFYVFWQYKKNSTPVLKISDFIKIVGNLIKLRIVTISFHFVLEPKLKYFFENEIFQDGSPNGRFSEKINIYILLF